MCGAPPRSGDRIACALIGPTACGKSRLAMQLAERLPIEIVSLDSAQVYRGMDIGTAKPSLKDRERVPHHLVDIVDPDAAYSVGEFRADALRVVDGILSRRRIPLFVGGTMLYYRALATGLDDLPRANAAIRAALDEEAAARGWPALHAELAQIDPVAGRRIAPGDAQRIQRALEVWRSTGRPISALQKTGGAPPPFRLASFAIVPQERATLHARIAGRFDAMLSAGLIDEVRSLRRRYRLSADLPSMRCVGYRQVWGFLDGEYDRAEMRNRAIVATRQLAKRQMTWLRSFREVQCVTEPDANQLAERFRSALG